MKFIMELGEFEPCKSAYGEFKEIEECVACAVDCEWHCLVVFCFCVMGGALTIAKQRVNDRGQCTVHSSDSRRQLSNRRSIDAASFICSTQAGGNTCTPKVVKDSRVYGPYSRRTGAN